MSSGKQCDYYKQYAVWAKDWPGATFSDKVEPPKPTEYLVWNSPRVDWEFEGERGSWQLGDSLPNYGALGESIQLFWAERARFETEVQRTILVRKKAWTIRVFGSTLWVETGNRFHHMFAWSDRIHEFVPPEVFKAMRERAGLDLPV